jgi:hypothetical protein
VTDPSAGHNINNALHKWSIDYKMKFHPEKCKVDVPVSPPDKALQDLFNKIFPLRNIYLAC